jgi:hypothetical protein
VDQLHEFLVAVIDQLNNEYKATVFILLDGFDEFSHEEQKKAMRYFVALSQSSGRLFLTTRPNVYESLKAKLPTAKTLEITTVSTDVEQYIDQKLEVAEFTLSAKKSIKAQVMAQYRGWLEL